MNNNVLTLPREPGYIKLIKGALYAVSLALYLEPYTSTEPIVLALACGMLGIQLADRWQRSQLRPAVGILGAVVTSVAAFVASRLILDLDPVASLLGTWHTAQIADFCLYAPIALALTFSLRLLAHQSRVFSLLELVFVIAALAKTFVAHQHRMLSRPRFLSDLSWSFGVDPGWVLFILGLLCGIAALFVFLHGPRFSKFLLSLVALAGLALLFYLGAGKSPEGSGAQDPLGLTNNGKGDRGKSGSGGASDLFREDYDSKAPPEPVAVAILRDDYTAPQDVLYFRQKVLSRYNGVSLTADPQWDTDIASAAGEQTRSLGANAQSKEHHSVVPTTMYLLVAHPQPPALVHARRIIPTQNPNPRQFVAAYDVESLVPTVPVTRLIGRPSIPSSWPSAARQHYTEIPNDPRYQTLSDAIVRTVDPRFAGDDLAKALAIKQYLEVNGFYTRNVGYVDGSDPTGHFLFGSLRGYCVHFAHAAVYLLRSQGIAARVALGYAVQTQKRSGGSSVLIMGDRAHAWPEIFLDGVGWVTFDIYPRQTDQPAPPPADFDLERMLGELARHDPTAGVMPDTKPLEIPWNIVTAFLALSLVSLFALGYVAKAYRRNAYVFWRRDPARMLYRAALDRLTEVGYARRPGETREEHAKRVATTVPHLLPLTELHLRRCFGGDESGFDAAEFARLARRVRDEAGQSVSWSRRWFGLLNPFSWHWTR